jgi:PBP1b-binding outer membrane lipoprotein LpoB
MKINVLFAAAISLAVACPSAPAYAARKKIQGVQDLDPNAKAENDGIGIASRDISAISDQIVRDLLSYPEIVDRPLPPRIIIQGADLKNLSMQRFQRDMLTDALRSQLNRASRGKLRFISRESAMLVEQERAMKEEGFVDGGVTDPNRMRRGADYQMIGKITSIDTRNVDSGTTQRRTQILFELVDLTTADIVWTGEPYVFLRATDMDIVDQ